MKFKDYALAIIFASALVPPPLVVSSEKAQSAGSRYLNTNEDQPFQFSSSAHACLLAYDIIRCVGYNYYGQLGLSTSNIVGTPVPLNFPSSISAKPIKVVTGYDHTCTLFNDKHVWCNGSNGFGQLGNGSTVNSATPVQVKKGTNVLTDVIDIEAGAYHNCAIQDTGAMYCWGFSTDGQLGMNDIMDGSTNEKKAVKMSLSFISTCVITGTETNPSKFVTCVGFGFTSENVVSTTVDLVNDAHKLTAGSHHFCALLVGGTAKCWGANNAGQLGIGSNDLNPRYDTTEDVMNSSTDVALTGITDINAGYLSTCLVADGYPMCFGNNHFYQLGIANGGGNVLYPTIVSIASVSGKTLISLHLGEQTGHAVYNDDTIYSMGTNYGGTFGDGSTVSSRNVIGDVADDFATQMKFVITFNLPPNDPNRGDWIHALCLSRVSHASAESDYGPLSYTSVLNFANGQLGWDDRDYTLQNVNDTVCNGGIYLKPSKIIVRDVAPAISVSAVPSNGVDFDVCAIVSSDERDGGWLNLLPTQGFTLQSGSLSSTFNAGVTELNLLCKTMAV